MTTEKREFRTEVKQLLDMMIHSLYSHKEIFLRELISNSSDAIDKARYESLTNKEIMEGEAEWKMKITPDKSAGTLTVSDNGIGMTRDEIVQALGTIAHSGTQEFIQAVQSRELKDNPELIGQFGVGFYSSFMVADKVTVISRKAGLKGEKGVTWESTADGTFTVDDADKESKGTDVILHLKEGEKKYLDEGEIRNIVRTYSDYIDHPIVMDVEREKESEIKKGEKYRVVEEETLNSGKALWLKDKSEIKDEEYNEFYKHVSHDFLDPLDRIHYKAEGISEFTVLLYIPSHRPFDIFYRDYRVGPALYVKRVQIMDHCEDLIAPYMRFIKGVVDSSDLPLNVSREILQANKQVEVMRNSITKKVLETLEGMKANDYEKYVIFYTEFGRILKEGVHFDFKRKEDIADLLLFESTEKDAGIHTTLQQYIDAMKEGQEEIYYITGSSRTEIDSSPYLEAFREKGYEVLIMLDEIDDIIMSSLIEFKGKKVKSVIKGEVELDKGSEKKKNAQKKFGKLIELIKETLRNDVKDVRLSGRLKDSPCCLVTEEGAIDPQMEKVLRSMGQEVPSTKKVLEINPSHPLFEAMKNIFEVDKKSTVLSDYAMLLYDQGLILEGSRPKDPASFTRLVAELMVEKAQKMKE